MDKAYPYRAGAVLAALLSATLLPAQVETARIIGTVRDQTGAVIAGAKVIITNTQTGVTYSTQSRETGIYESIPLRVGEYRVSAEAAGFKRAVLS